MQDPYANVFFPKHRVEKLVEPIEKEQVATITTPGTSMRETVKVLGRGEWMSGCPEGG
jgi:hypothetical protein